VKDVNYPTYKHGHGYSSPTYRSWKMMRVRCTWEADKQYKDYGGRGITFDPRWGEFTIFLADMGLRPERTTLDRIDNSGNYTVANCRWADDKTQRRNRRDNHIVQYHGRQITLAQACEESGAKYDTAKDRLNRYGWTPERTFATLHDARTDRHDRADK